MKLLMIFPRCKEPDMAGTKGAEAVSPEQQVAINLGRAYFTHVMKQHKPDMTKEERIENWRQSKKQFVALGRRVLRSLEKDGYKIVAGN